MERLFKAEEKYTTFDIDGMLAMTHKRQFQVVEVKENGDAVYKLKGKRKLFLLQLETQDYANGPIKKYKGAVFIGWDNAFTCDTDAPKIPAAEGMTCNTMRGNACYNFLGGVEEIKNWLDEGNINPNFDKTSVLAISADGSETVVYVDEYRGGHAVIDRVLAKA